MTLPAERTLTTRSGMVRIESIDAVRSIALLGIIILNYHGYLNRSRAIGANEPNFFVRIMDAWNGVLAPSPVIFVVVSGIGCALLSSANFDRVVLVRRGLFLFTIGSMFEWVWNGTILPYFGVYFLLAAIIGSWSRRNIALVAVFCTLSAAVLSHWVFVRNRAGHSTAWLSPALPDSPRNVVFRYFIDYTHPVLPWFTFFCLGLIIGRSLPWFMANRLRLLGALVPGVAAVYTLSTVVRRTTDGAWQHVTSTDPFERGVLATVGVAMSAVIVIIVVSRLAEVFASSSIVDVLVRAGRTTLTLYVMHGLTYNLVVNRLHWVKPAGLDVAVGLAALVWIFLLAFGAWWNRFIGTGPIERAMRRFAG